MVKRATNVLHFPDKIQGLLRRIEGLRELQTLMNDARRDLAEVLRETGQTVPHDTSETLVSRAAFAPELLSAEEATIVQARLARAAGFFRRIAGYKRKGKRVPAGLARLAICAMLDLMQADEDLKKAAGNC